MTLYNYKITVSPWYPNYQVARKPANSDEPWEVVTNGASTRGVIKKALLKEVEKMFEEQS